MLIVMLNVEVDRIFSAMLMTPVPSIPWLLHGMSWPHLSPLVYPLFFNVFF